MFKCNGLRLQNCAGDTAQWERACLVCVKLKDKFPVLKKKFKIFNMCNSTILSVFSLDLQSTRTGSDIKPSVI